MVQSGIAYAAGQLLAVVAPRTVLVVDAPTDWSLAGPLWELALDDAPVDEILDVLIRRGIRTAPSFAIVRVENDAVRALVRGSVPVCFERVGEPVRLDATGATTWLEGLISSARRVLVGAVETNTTLPFLVSTGVVLVSGLALPCGPAEPADRGGNAPGVSESGEPGSSANGSSGPNGASGSPSEDPYYSRTPATPVPAGSSAGSGYNAPTGREPRVVDLTRSGGRGAPAKAYSAGPPAAESRDSWALASSRAGAEGNGRGQRGELNGHVPAVLEPAPAGEAGFESASAFESTPAFESPSAFESTPAFEPSPAYEAATPYEAPASYEASEPYEAPVADYQPNYQPPYEPPTSYEPPKYEPSSLLEADPTPAVSAAASTLFTESRPAAEPVASAASAPAVESPSYAEPEPAPAAESAFRFEPVDFSTVSADDPGELHDLDQPEHTPYQAPAPVANDFFAPPAGYQGLEPVARPADVPQPPATAPDPFDDLLLDPADRPVGPSPVDLPNLDPPSLSLPIIPGANGFGVPAQPRGFSNAPAAWPPAGWPPSPPDSFRGDSRQDSGSAHQAGSYQPTEIFAADPQQASRYTGGGLADEPADDEQDQGEPSALNGEHADVANEAEEPDRAEAPSSAFSPPPHANSEPPALGELPLRVRGRSLRPEHRPLNGNRLLGSPDQDQSVHAGQASPAAGLPRPAAAPASGSLLLPAFFRGARAARKPDGSDVDSDSPEALADQDDANGSSVPSAWLPQGPGPAAPAVWVPPVRRGFPDRSSSGAGSGSGFNGGPPAMPGVLRPATPSGGSPAADFEPPVEAEESTEMTPGPGPRTPAEGIASHPAPEALREPPRLLGVWCDAGHVTSPDHDECRVCGLAVPAQAPILVARPPLGVLIFDNGDRVMVDRPVVLGRDPKPVASPDPEAPVLHPVPSATGQVSRTHAEIRASGWDVVLTDLDAMNGTALTLPGATPLAIEPGVPTVIVPGARVDLGGESGFVFEVEA